MIECSVHTTPIRGSSQGALVFNRDMFMNMPLLANCHAIMTQRKHVINSNLIRPKANRLSFVYVGDQGYLLKTARSNKARYAHSDLTIHKMINLQPGAVLKQRN